MSTSTPSVHADVQQVLGELARPEPRSAVVIDGSGQLYGELARGIERLRLDALIRCINWADPWRCEWAFNPLLPMVEWDGQRAVRTLVEALGSESSRQDVELQEDCISVARALHKANASIFKWSSPRFLHEQLLQKTDVLLRLLTACSRYPEVRPALKLFRTQTGRSERAVTEVRRRFGIFADPVLAAVTSHGDFAFEQLAIYPTILVVESTPCGGYRRDDALTATLIEQCGRFLIDTRRMRSNGVPLYVLRSGRMPFDLTSGIADALKGFDLQYGWGELGPEADFGRTEENRDPARGARALAVDAPRLRWSPLQFEVPDAWFAFLSRC